MIADVFGVVIIVEIFALAFLVYLIKTEKNPHAHAEADDDTGNLSPHSERVVGRTRPD